MILKLVVVWSEYRQKRTSLFEDTIHSEKYKEQILNPFFEQPTDDECWYAFFQQDCYCSHSKGILRSSEKYWGTESLVVVCGEHAPPTSTHVTFIYWEL
jgi:hypothetical protein